MSEIETLGILDEIETLVSDKLQVVSYKWLSRSFSVSSNVAKRLLQEFVEKRGSSLEAVYTLSGWLKSDPPSYHIRLVTGPTLTEAREEFDGNCSVQVYSVQSCIPKDPASLWNTEFVQAEELFKQPPAVDNCLRDNRFCGISNPLVKRSTDGTPARTVAPRPGAGLISGPTKCSSALQDVSVAQPQQKKPQQSIPEGGRQHFLSRTTDVKKENNEIKVHGLARKPASDKEKAPVVPANRSKEHNANSSGSGSSLSNLWGRASAKSKPSCAPAEADNPEQKTVVNAEVQIRAREASDDDDDDDVEHANFKRASNGEGVRKRRVVFDFSDEEDVCEDAVNLASPDLPKEKAKLVIPEKCNLNFDMQAEIKPTVKEEKGTGRTSNQDQKTDSSDITEGKKSEVSTSKKSEISPNDVKKKDEAASEALNSPKRRKVLKTRIDERGREVTEVVWEGEEMKPKEKNDDGKKADNNSLTGNINRSRHPAKKSQATEKQAPSNPVAKTGNKKAGLKDPKQGNIMSFFKKV